MPLDLKLHRIQKLLKVLGNPHFKPYFIHIAGTNGKGSVCSYISHILSTSGINNGRFNSPHLITPRDSIQINDNPVSETLYAKCSKLINDTNLKYGIGCTEFELLTCIAFQIFFESNISIAILEVGVGGRLDATNVIPAEKTLVVGITKVGLDHQTLLGSTLSEIAYQKVGIFKKNVPAVIDGSNLKEVIDVASEEAKKIGCELNIARRDIDCYIKPKLLGDYQYDNLAVALKIISLIKESEGKITKESIENGIQSTVWPGRLQEYDLDMKKLNIENGINSDTFSILLDGAHNTQASIELGKYLEHLKSSQLQNFIFIIAITKGKNLRELFKPIITAKDTVIFTEFSDNVEGMPWVKPSDVHLLRDEIDSQDIKYSDMYTIRDVKEALIKAYNLSQSTGKKVVVCGSLYLVADILRL